MKLVVLVLCGYLSGSVPYGKLIARRYGVDIQKQGSGNIGFANAYRTLGLRPALVVLVLDVVKGWVPAVIAIQFVSADAALLVGAAAMAGHVFTPWLKFRGGKGIATGLGVTLAVVPLVAAAGLVVYGLVLHRFHKFALASLTAAWCLPLFCWYLAPHLAGYYLPLALFVSWTHRANIRPLLVSEPDANG